MKVLILVGLFSATAIPFAAAAQTTSECQLDDTRRASVQRAAQPTPIPVRTAGAAPAEPAVRQAPRRRSVKRIPDAELIGPRGAL